MYKDLEREKILLYQELYALVKTGEQHEAKASALPREFTAAFFTFLDKINLHLMEAKEDFYSYFLVQMDRELIFSLASPTGVNFKHGKFVLYVNPLQFLTLEIEQMFTTLQHEVLHIVSLHLLRVQEFSENYSKLVLNLAMDVTVNNYLTFLPPAAIDLAWVNRQYNLHLKPFETLEYYVEELNKVVPPLKKTPTRMDKGQEEGLFLEFNPETTHDLWTKNDPVEASVLAALVENYAAKATHSTLTGHVGTLVEALKKEVHELPWSWYLRKLVGKMPSDYKRTMARRSRRQPTRVELPGRLRRRQAKVLVALDISGSVSDAEFRQAMKEVLAIVKVYKQEITVVECDSEIRRSYRVRTLQDIKERLKERGGTKFQPVLDFAQQGQYELVVYFTDGKGEEKLERPPKGYQILWVLSGRSENLSVGTHWGITKKLKQVKVVDNILDSYDVEQGGFSMNCQESIALGK